MAALTPGTPVRLSAEGLRAFRKREGSPGTTGVVVASKGPPVLPDCVWVLVDDKRKPGLYAGKFWEAA